MLSPTTLLPLLLAAGSPAIADDTSGIPEMELINPVTTLIADTTVQTFDDIYDCKVDGPIVQFNGFESTDNPYLAFAVTDESPSKKEDCLDRLNNNGVLKQFSQFIAHNRKGDIVREDFSFEIDNGVCRVFLFRDTKIVDGLILDTYTLDIEPERHDVITVRCGDSDLIFQNDNGVYVPYVGWM